MLIFLLLESPWVPSLGTESLGNIFEIPIGASTRTGSQELQEGPGARFLNSNTLTLYAGFLMGGGPLFGALQDM